MKKVLCYLLTVSMVVSLLAVTASADTSDSASDAETTLTLNELMESIGGDLTTDALSDLYANFNSGLNEDGSADDSVYDYVENQVTEGLNTLSDDDYATAFDLRHVGGTVTYNDEKQRSEITGGKSYVTPVKFQNPWGTCWAFGITAASETSILSELDAGTDTVDNNNIDLSERHLAWFTKNHIPAVGEEGYGVNYVDNQDGEGIWYIEQESESSSMSGGWPFLGATSFSTGTGIVIEDFAPYVGKNGMVEARRKSTADKKVYTEKTLYFDSVEDWENASDEIKANYTLWCYSDKDDWSLDESLRFYHTFTIEESSVLPSAAGTKDKTTGEIVLNEDGINAIKSELTQGRAVEVCYYADASDPNADVTLNTSRYINSNYAQYTWDQTRATHSVCIVGWDDDYSASNFGQEHPVKYDSKNRVIYKLIDSDQVLTYTKDSKSLYYVDDQNITHTYKTDSEEIEPVREEDGSDTVPAGNGAWIVKNSWGATTNEFPNCHTWGSDGTGYFYLSYYDTSIRNLETYDFAVGEEETEENSYSIINQYDYMPAISSDQSVAYAPVMMANVFTAQETMEIDAISCETTTPGTSVIYGICLLDDDEDYPAGDDKIITNLKTYQYEYGGYHKEKLDSPVTILEGQKYAVVAMEYYLTADNDGNISANYCICSNTGFSKEEAEKYDVNYYFEGIINPGESYIITYGYHTDDIVATDYYNYVTNIKKFKQSEVNTEFDNFSIKAYANPVSGYTAAYENLSTDTVVVGDKFTADVCVTSDEELASGQMTITADGTHAKIVSVKSKLSNFSSNISADGTSAVLSFYGNELSAKDGLVVATVTYEAIAEGDTEMKVTSGIAGKSDSTEDYGIAFPDALEVTIYDGPVSAIEYGGNYSLVKYEPTAGTAYTYNGNAMYSRRGKFYSVISKGDEVENSLVAQAESGIAYSDVAKGDVNENGQINIVDAQITYSIATCVYSGFDVLTPDQIIKADVNEDLNITALDARAIQVKCMTSKED